MQKTETAIIYHAFSIKGGGKQKTIKCDDTEGMTMKTRRDFFSN